MFSQSAFFALLISFAAGLSTLFGAGVIFFSSGKNERMLSIALGFAGGIMLSVSFMDLYPNAEHLFKAVYSERQAVLFTVLFFIIGLLMAGLIDRFVPHEAYDPSIGEKPHKNLFRVGLVSTIAIGLHNFPEGIATFMAGYKDVSLGISIAIAISLHNIPEGIAVAMPVYYATNSKKKAIWYTLLSGMAEPVGALLAFLFLRPFINDTVLGAVFASVAGIMTYITVEELIPSSRQYGHDRDALLATFCGICLMPVTHAI